MKSFYVVLFAVILKMPLWAQCPTCGDGTASAGETNLNCPTDVPHPSTCASPCGQPGAFETAAGIRISRDFVGTTTYSTAGLPAGWSFAGAPSATTAGALPAADVFGAKAGLVQPNCSGSCTGTNFFCIGNIANNVALGGGGTSGGKLGTNFDGRANIAQNLSYAVLRGQGSPTLVSETFNFSAVEGFKIQFWLAASESSCGTGGGWGSCVGNEAFLDFSSNGGTSWTQVLRMTTSSTNTDMCSFNSSNTLWFKEGAWSRVCLTVFKTTTSPGNFYPAAKGTTAASGMMLDPQWFTANFKFRIRYSQTASCNNFTATNPGRYLAIDYPTVTSGNQLIPCGISFANLCGYGADNNDDGVGGSGTTNVIAHGTVRRSINNAERGVEIFAAQNATFGALNTSGSSLPSNFDLCNAEGGDKQCIDWRTNNNGYFVVYECITDWEAPSGTGINVNYYKGTAAASFGLSKVTTAGKTALLGWRYSGSRFVSCANTSDLNAGCNGYQFQSASLPTQFGRGFYALATNGLGEGWSFYGASSCSHYFNGPFIAPISVPTPDAITGEYTTCNGTDLVFTGNVAFCSSSSGFTGSPSLSITGPGGFSETIAAGGTGSTPITLEGDYTIKANPPISPSQCLDCGRTVCITITTTNLGECITTPLDLTEWSSEVFNAYSVLLKWTIDLPTDMQEFYVERSADGIAFQPIATIPRLPEQTAYQWFDHSPLDGANYYRLKARLTNGSIDSSAVLVETVSSAPLVRVYPNPVTHLLRVTAAPQARVQLYDATGRVLLTRIFTQTTEELDLQAFPNGIYWLRYSIGEDNGWRKIVIGR